MGVGDMENALSSNAAVQKYFEAKARREIEEDEEHIQTMLQEGALTEVQARGIAARRAMHKQEDDGGIAEGVAIAAGYVTTEQMIEEHLDETWLSKSPMLRMVKDILGLQRLEAAINRARRARQQPDWVHPYPSVHRVVKSNQFEAFIGSLILANGLTIGVSTSLAGEEVPPGLDLAEHIFTLLFCLEVVGRFMANGWTWFFKLSNALDVSLILFTGILPLWILQPIGVDSTIMRPLQLMRVLRIVRLIRMVRTISVLRILWELIEGVTETRMTLLWIWVTMGAVMFMMSVLCVNFITRSDSFLEDPVAEEFFGDVPLSMVTLFQIVTLDSWHAIARPLMKKSPWIPLIFVLIIAVLVMVLLNLIVAIIVNNAFARKEQDTELQAADLKRDRETAINRLQYLIELMDVDNSGMISRQEYAEAVKKNEEVREMLAARLGVEPGDEMLLWDEVIMPGGADEQAEIKIAEFVHALRMMQGEAKARESYRITRLSVRQNDRLKRLQWRIRHSAETARGLRAECHKVQEELAIVLQTTGDFLKFIGRCVPESPAPRSEEDLQEMLEKLQDRCQEATSDEALVGFRRTLFDPTATSGSPFGPPSR